jgi:PLD-like domain
MIGLPFQIGIASRSTSVPLAEVVKVTAGLNLQISRDFAPIWGMAATVVAIPNPDAIDPGVWPIFIDDDIGVDAAGFHHTRHNQPYARIESGPTWSLTASHECLELLADPTGNRLYPSVAIGLESGDFHDRGDAKFEYLIEVCDPCQDEACAYLVNDVLVSDFYTPHFFDHAEVASVRYSFSGKITRPRQILKGGYLSWLDPQGNGFVQARYFEHPEIVKIPLPPDGCIPTNTTLRGLLDRQMPPANLSKIDPRDPISHAQDLRENWLGMAAPSRAVLYGAASPHRAPSAVNLLAATSPVRTVETISAIIALHRATLGLPGVMTARPGWLLADQWLQHERAIVIICNPDRLDAIRAALPDSIEGVPVNVRPATVQQQFRHDNPRAYAVLASGPRREYEVPDFPGEIHFAEPGQQSAPESTAAELMGAARNHKTQLDYTRPHTVTLDPIEEEMTLQLHASPDAGWQMLREFLTSAPGDRVVAMYDFTAPHIEKALLDGLGANGQLTLTLDHPPGKDSREQTIDETESKLEELGKRLKFAWALEGHDPKVSEFIFPNAYHIKVAVRPDDVMWLSSGNWNTSNQPEIDLSDRGAAIEVAKQSDRDWHLIARSPSLSNVFREYLNEDNKVALQHQAPAVDAVAALSMDKIPDELLALEAARPASSVSFFPPHKVEGKIRVRPLLTPFDYQPHILELINGATSRFWMQTQYIKVSGKKGDEDHDALIEAVAKRIAAGVDVRLITSTYQTPDLIEKLMDAGIDNQVLRLQPRVHNKGMIVDSRTVVISSQNWSADGTLRNRDAGLIIYDNEEAAQYFEQIFLHDWAHLASQHVSQ